MIILDFITIENFDYFERSKDLLLGFIKITNFNTELIIMLLNYKCFPYLQTHYCDLIINNLLLKLN